MSGRGPAARVVGAVADPPGMPPGVLPAAIDYATAAAALLAPAVGADVEVDAEAAAACVLAPALLADAPPAPPAPLAAGDGWVAADVGAAGDAERLAVLRGTLPPAAGPDALAAAAQEWRLPVLPYAARPAAARAPARGARRGAVRAVDPAPLAAGTLPFAGVVVCDLTAMWAGPLATALLAALGAEVVKVEAAVRPDGLRRWGLGSGAPGPSALWRSLDLGKAHADLDLRTDAGRRGLHALIARSDLVVDSFSRRVMPNLGLTPPALRAINPRVQHLGIRAFPPGPRAHWVAYGTGVHAAAGLGDLGGGLVAAPAVSYPDPLAGLLAFATLIEQLRARAAGRAFDAEVTLADAVAPLLAAAGPGRLAEPLTRAALVPLQGRAPEPAALLRIGVPVAA